MEQDNIGIWYRKNNWKDFYLNYDNDVIPEGCTRVEPLGGVECQKWDEEAGEWVADPEAETQAEILEYKAELAELDKEAVASRFIRDTSMAYALANGMADGKGYEDMADIEERAAAIREKLRPLLNPEEE